MTFDFWMSQITVTVAALLMLNGAPSSDSTVFIRCMARFRKYGIRVI